MDDHPERRRIVEQFRQLLDTLPDEKSGVVNAMDFIYEVIRSKQGVLPITEMITLLKHTKPMVFLHLRNAVAPTSRLYFVIQLDMNVQDAYKRLGWSEDRVEVNS